MTSYNKVPVWGAGPPPGSLQVEEGLVHGQQQSSDRRALNLSVQKRRKTIILIASIAGGIATLALIIGLAYGLRHRRIEYKCPAAGPGVQTQFDLTFFVVGDWGRANAPQKRVADMMAQLAPCYKPSFIVSTGDNFYSNGLKGPDDPFFLQAFTDIYSADSLMLPWYAVLGNHDYGELEGGLLQSCASTTGFAACPPGCCYSPVWQTNMTAHDWRWNLKQGAWKLSFMEGQLDLIMIDTNPQIARYRAAAWGNMAGGINSQDPAAGQEAVRQLLATSTAPWKVVVGHHPVRSYGVHCTPLQPGGVGGDCAEMQWLRLLLKQYNATLYLAGHDHNLQLIKTGAGNPDPDPVYYVVSGAGSDVRSGEFDKVPNTAEADFLSDQNGFLAVGVSRDSLTLHFWAERVGTPAYSVTIPLPKQ